MRYRPAALMFLFAVLCTLLIATAGVLLSVSPAWAQTGANLSGMVTDQTGAALRDVAVTSQERRYR